MREGEKERENMTLMRGVGPVILTPEGVRQRSDISHTAFELRSLMRPCLSSEKLFVAVFLFFPNTLLGEPLRGLILNRSVYSLAGCGLMLILQGNKQTYRNLRISVACSVTALEEFREINSCIGGSLMLLLHNTN